MQFRGTPLRVEKFPIEINPQVEPIYIQRTQEHFLYLYISIHVQKTKLDSNERSTSFKNKSPKNSSSVFVPFINCQVLVCFFLFCFVSLFLSNDTLQAVQHSGRVMQEPSLLPVSGKPQNRSQTHDCGQFDADESQRTSRTIW